MYRGFSIFEKKWVYGFLFIAEDMKGKKQYQILRPDYFIGLYKMHVVNPETVESYVNYDDSNGNPIYENDTVIIDELECYGGNMKQAAGKAVIYKGMACLKIKKKYMPAENPEAVIGEDVYIPLYRIRKIYRIINTDKINSMSREV